MKSQDRQKTRIDTHVGPKRNRSTELAPRLFRDVLGVIDLKQSFAVHAIAGHRANYQAVNCDFTRDGNPIRLAEAYLRMGVGALYVADLDAIEGTGSNESTIEQLIDLGVEIWLDQGMKDRPASDRSLLRRVVGTESLSGLEQIPRLTRHSNAKNIILSIDTRNQIVQFSRTDSAPTPSAVDVAEIAADCGIRQLIVLDLGLVGTGAGPETASICRQLTDRDMALDVASGGGIRDMSDLITLKNAGCGRFLIGTALHDGGKNFAFESGSC